MKKINEIEAYKYLKRQFKNSYRTITYRLKCVKMLNAYSASSETTLVVKTTTGLIFYYLDFIRIRK